MKMNFGNAEDWWTWAPKNKTPKRPDFRRVNQPEHYETAPSWLVRTRFDRIRWESGGRNHGNKYPINLIRDVAALDQGGAVRPIVEILAELESTGIAPSDPIALAQIEAWNFVKAVDLSKVPIGNTPLERAVYYMASAEDTQGGMDMAAGAGSGEDALPRSFSNGNGAGEELAERLNKAWEQVGQMSEEELKDLQASQKKLSRGRRYDNSEGKNIVEIVAKAASGSIFKVMDNIARTLDVRVESSVTAEIDWRDDPDGRDIRPRPYEGPHDAPYLSVPDRAIFIENPVMGAMRLVTGDATVYPRSVRETKKQLVVMVVDASGSMGGASINVAAELIHNRSQLAVKGEAEMHWAHYSYQLNPFVTVTTEDQATREFIAKTLMSGSTMGGTCTWFAMRSAIAWVEKEVQEGRLAAHPHMMLVSDGDCDFSNSMIAELAQMMGELGIKFHFFFIGHPSNAFRTVSASRLPENVRMVQAVLNGADASVMSEMRQTSAIEGQVILARATGGLAYYINNENGEPIPTKHLLGVKSDAYEYNPYNQMGIS